GEGALLFSMLGYWLLACLRSCSPASQVLFACRELFDIGLGGRWAAGMPLAIEHWPAELRGTVSGMLQSGYSMGFMVSAFVYQFVYPLVNRGNTGWRMMLWLGALPALLVFWIMRSVKESPVWLEGRKARATDSTGSLAISKLFDRDLVITTLHTSLVMSAFLIFYHSITFWYPTL